MTEAIRRNDIAGEGGPGSIRPCRQRIINRERIAVSVANVAEVAVPHSRRRHAGLCEITFALLEALPVKEPERLVLAVIETGYPDWSTGPASVLVADQLGGCAKVLTLPGAQTAAVVAHGFKQCAV